MNYVQRLSRIVAISRQGGNYIVMNRIKRYFALSFAVIALSMVGLSAETFASTSDDQALERKAYKELRKLPRYSVFDNINVDVNGGVATLTGKVITLGTKRDAAAYVKDVKGITNVVNNIDELPVGSFDNRIRYAALNTFVNRGPAQYFAGINPDVRIIVEDGRITLEGFVAHTGDYNLLNILANGIPGVFEVKNNLVVGRDTRRS